MKDHEHMRRSTQVKCKKIQFTRDMRVTHKRENFLSNKKNKGILIAGLKSKLELDGQKVSVGETDADTIITKVALEV